jgi:transcriptional regulator with XRE-family HTH domain
MKTEYELYCELKDKLHLKDAEIAKMSGVSKSTFSDWKAGRYIPKTEKLTKIANAMGVTLDYFTGQDSAETYYINEDTAKVAQKIFENKDLRMLFDAVEDATPQDLLALHGMALALKRKERGNIDDTGC